MRNYLKYLFFDSSLAERCRHALVKESAVYPVWELLLLAGSDPSQKEKGHLI